MLSITCALVLLGWADGVPKPGPADLKCGQYCVYIALRSLDLITDPYSVFERSLPPSGPDGYSMLDLERIASGRKAQTLALETGIEPLRGLPSSTVILAYFQDRYVIVKGVGSTEPAIGIIDPPYQYDLSLDKFNALFLRRVLLISDGPILLPGDGQLLPAVWVWAIALVFCSLCVVGLLVMSRWARRRA